MKVDIVVPKNRFGFNGIKLFDHMPNLAAWLLKQLIERYEHEWLVEIIDERVRTVDFENSPDIVMITSYTATFARAANLADQYRQQSRAIVIMGGPHVSFRPQEALAHAHAVVIGEAELVMQKLLQDIRAGNLQKKYAASSYADISKLEIDCLAPHLKNLFPGIRVFSTWATRGCPTGCDFCSVWKMYGRKLRHRSIDAIVTEIRRAQKQHPRKKIMVAFHDDNIAADKVFARELFTQLKSLHIWWMSQLSIDIAKDKELLKLALESGFFGGLFGFESIDQEDMAGTSPLKVRLVNCYPEYIEAIRSGGATVYGAFILGLPNHKADIFQRIIDYAARTNIDILQLTINTPLPGTKLYYDLASENRLQAKEWVDYDMMHLVFKHPHLSQKEIEDGLWKCYKAFYSHSSILKRFLHSVSKLGLRKSLIIALINLSARKALRIKIAGRP